MTPPSLSDYRAKAPSPERRQGGLRVGGGLSKKSEPGMPLVSVVTVVFNGVETLERTIKSVLGQSYSQVEYIIVDGGSTDGTLDIIKRYESRIAYWVSEKDRGIFDAMNKGVALASGDWIHILNGDDSYCDYDVLSKVMQKADPAKANYFSLILESPEGLRRLHNFAFALWKLYLWAGVLHPCLIVTRKQYESLGLFDLSFRDGADHDFMLRLFKAYPSNHHDIPMTIMPQTGNSARNLWRATRDFMEITVRHGLPRWIAFPIAVAKYAVWRIPTPVRRLVRKVFSSKTAYR